MFSHAVGSTFTILSLPESLTLMLSSDTSSTSPSIPFMNLLSGSFFTNITWAPFLISSCLLVGKASSGNVPVTFASNMNVSALRAAISLWLMASAMRLCVTSWM